MPRKFFKRIMPSHTEIKNNKYLGIFGDALHNPNLWHMNRRSVAGAFAVGLFFAWVPLPTQMVMAAAAAIIFHTNLTLSIVVVWITNPVTIPPMFYFAYLVGTWILGESPQHFEFHLTFEWLSNELSAIWKPFLTGCLVMATSSSAIGYIGVSRFWSYAVRKERAKRQGKSI